MSFKKSGTNKSSAGFWLTLGVCVLCLFVVALSFVLIPKNETQNDKMLDTTLTNLTNQPLVNKKGWNASVLSDLRDASQRYGDNVALGNANGVQGVLVSFGGYTWEVVYIQDNVITLYACDSVATMVFDAQDLDYAKSNVRAYLNDEFYPQLLKNIGFAQFDDYVVATGGIMPNYQIHGMQNVELLTTDNLLIQNNDISTQDKVWLPSAYEVGGFLNGDNASTERVNSFNLEIVSSKNVSTGLWNLSSTCRMLDTSACLRSTTTNGVVYIGTDGNLLSGDLTQTFSIRPALNIMIPQKAEDTGNLISNSVNLAITGLGTQSNPYTISTVSDLLTLSSNVLQGNTYTGKYIVLNNDIDLSGVTVWTPIGLYNKGTDSKPFSGIFDGQGYVVRHASSANSGLVGLFGYVSGGTIKNVAVSNTNWSTAGDYAGGVVSVMDNGATLSESYNNSSVSGAKYVGGLTGYINNATIINVYNTGAVAGSDAVGGLVGQISSATITNAYNIGTVSSNNDVLGSAGTDFGVSNTYYTSTQTQSYGTNCDSLDSLRSASTFVGFDFYSSTNLTGVWFKSNILNDGFPTLKIFVKQVEIKLYSSNNSAGDYYVTLADANTKYKSTISTLGTNATFVAQCSSGYRFLGWYTIILSTSGAPVLGSDEAVLVNDEAQFTEVLTDYVYLEARFVKTYNVSISTLYSDFSTSYTNNDAVSVSSQGVSNGSQYDVNAILTITVKTDIQELSFVGLGYKTSATSTTYTSIGTDLNNNYGYWTSVTQNADSIVYVLTVGDVDAFTTDEFDIQVHFERQLQLTLGTTTNGTDHTPSASVQFGANGAQITASTTTVSDVFVYNITGGLRLSVDYTNASVDGVAIYNLDHWTLTIDGVDTTLDSDTTSINIASCIPITTDNDDIFDITLIANFLLNTHTVSANVALGTDLASNDSGVNKLASIYILVGSGVDVNSITSEHQSISVAYGALVSICFVPNYAYGYEYLSLAVNGEDVTPAQNDDGVYYYDLTVGTSAVIGEIKVKYILINIQPSVAMLNNDAYTTITDNVSCAPTQFTNIDFYTDISALQLNMATTDNFYMCYGLKQLEASFDNGTTFVLVKTYGNEVAKAQYTLFNSGTLASLLYQQANTALSPTTNTVLLRVVIYPVNTTLNIVAYYKGTSSVVDASAYTLELSKDNQITSNLTAQQYSYILGSNVTINTTASNLGHKVLGYGTSANMSTGFFGTQDSDNYKNTSTYTYTITQDTTLYVYFELRTFSVAFESDANTLASSSATLQSQGITARDLSKTGNLTLSFDKDSTTTSTIKMDYGHTLAFGANSTTTISSIDLVLMSIVVQDVATGTQLAQYGATTLEHTFVMLEGSEQNIYDSIKIMFTYNYKQTVYIKIASSVTDTSQLNGATIQFNNQDIVGNSTSVKLNDNVINQAQTNTNGYGVSLVADSDGTKYTALFLMNISYKVTISGTSTSSTQFELELKNGEPVTFIINEVKFDNNAVNISGYFVFS